LYNLYFYLFAFILVGFPCLYWGSSTFPYLAGCSSVSLLYISFQRVWVQRQRKSLLIKHDDAKESINLLEAEVKEKTIFKNRIPSNIENIKELEDLLERLNTLRSIDNLPVYVLDHLRKLYPRCSNILFFSRNEAGQELRLLETNRENRMVSIQEKDGDIFDYWILQQNKSVLVPNLDEEFRFPVSEAIAPKSRKIQSFIASPLTFGKTVLGIIRIESPRKSFFDLSDLRVLSAVCSLAAVFMERLVMMKKVSELAIRDSLTGLFLRDHFVKRLREEVASAFLLEERVSLLMIDIDNFKQINDTYGHSVGDYILKELTSLARRILIKEGNLLCRFGGEEFLALLKLSKGEAIQMAEMLRKGIAEMKVNVRNKEVSVTVSVGVVSYPDDALTAEDMVFTADTFMYKAKQSGKNMVCSA